MMQWLLRRSRDGTSIRKTSLYLTLANGRIVTHGVQKNLISPVEHLPH